MARGRDVIILRSLTDSDLGLFSAHRKAATSRQRAININSDVARQLLSPELFEAGAAVLQCVIQMGIHSSSGRRPLKKTGKNWRLGGAKLVAKAYGQLNSKDFVLIRSIEHNDGSAPLNIVFIGRHADRVVHAGLAAIAERSLRSSMAVYTPEDRDFAGIARFCPELPDVPHKLKPAPKKVNPRSDADISIQRVPPMPREVARKPPHARSIREKLRAPHMLERMLQVAGDLSAPAQLRFMETVEALASQLRTLLLETGGILKVDRDHQQLWSSVEGRAIGFVDGGLANMAMFGSAPIAARVGGYVVVPGDRSPHRERFSVLKCMIDELYAHESGGVYEDTYPDLGALRDAARISIEAAGAIRLVTEQPDLAWVMMHGALVNPVSRYTDVMRDGKVRHAFPDFTDQAVKSLLPDGFPPPKRKGERQNNFINVHLAQLRCLAATKGVVCGVVERESTTTSVVRALLDGLREEEIAHLLPVPVDEWKEWFRKSLDPSDDPDSEGQRITDSLIFRCVLEPGEALRPVLIERNEMRRAPRAWGAEISEYPKPFVSYLQPTEWNAPVRVEVFEKDLGTFGATASLIMHCCLLLPRYAFPVGLDIVDKFAKVPDWMSRPVNTHTAVQALKGAMESGDTKLIDALRRMLCGSKREWLLRPGMMR